MIIRQETPEDYKEVYALVKQAYLRFELSLFGGGFNHALIQKQAVGEIMKYNDLTARYGRVLTEQQAVALVQTRSLAIKETGRIEFGGDVISRLSGICYKPKMYFIPPLL